MLHFLSFASSQSDFFSVQFRIGYVNDYPSTSVFRYQERHDRMTQSKGAKW